MAEQNLEQYYKNPYLFNAKELDRETGLYYYGARYYNPKLSMWYGVDPLAEKFPSWSPYVYTFDNPVNFIDPTGMEPDGPGDKIRTRNMKEVVIKRRTSWWKRNIVRPLRNLFTPSKYSASGMLIHGMTDATEDLFTIRRTSSPLKVGDGIDKSNFLRGSVQLLDKTIGVSRRYNDLRSGDIQRSGRTFMEIESMLLGGGSLKSRVITPKLIKFSGTERAFAKGATPNSIYTYLSADGKIAVSNYIYNSQGKVSFQVDFQIHGKTWLSGHGHNMTTPGILRSGHLPNNHIPHNLVPAQYKVIPNGTTYSSPLAK